jgi:predicted DNA-binding protein with PD1-like motif
MFGIIAAFIAWGYLQLIMLMDTQVAQEGRGAMWHGGSFTTIRLVPGEDIKETLLSFTKAHKLSAASIVSAVGSVSALKLRTASTRPDTLPTYLHDDTKHEIVSLSGTLEYSKATDSAYCHLHMSAADDHGRVIGGHLMPGTIVFTTAEITILNIPRLKFRRMADARTGWKELKITESEGYLFMRGLRAYKGGAEVLVHNLLEGWDKGWSTIPSWFSCQYSYFVRGAKTCAAA